MSQCQTFTDEQIALLRTGGSILRACLHHMATLVEPGRQTAELDREAEAFIRERGGLPGFKGYNGFPATLCTSVNAVCVHGIPDTYALQKGDIIGIDCGVLYEGFYTDACITVPVGAVSTQAQELIAVTQDALNRVVALVCEGIHVGDISSTVQKTAESAGFHPVRALTGHGLGTHLHQFPDIPNIGKAGTGPRLPARTIIAVEPIISAGSDAIVEERDGWTLSTKDGSLCAHFEHTILVLPQGCEVLT